MDYINLGRSGLRVSRIALGCMSFGVAKRRWFLDEAQSRPFFRRAIERGINFFDTANMYGDGASEEVTGRALREYGKRDEIVLATKLYFPMHGGANAQGLSRKSVLTEIDASLRRLGTDYIDLYQIHRFDETTPVEETIDALHDTVRAGKVRYLGASSMQSWRFAKMLYVADQQRAPRFVSMQPHYNLLYREEEREMLGLCRDEGIGVLPWSPLARGRLARPWATQSSARSGDDPWGDGLYAATEASDRKIVDRVGELAAARGRSHAQIALAWLLHQQDVTAPIVGVTKIEQLDEAIDALAVKLSTDEIASLEAPYTPRAVVGFGR
ncbi:aldo/keto reductase [Roseiterribacter gracilis]|uniref:Oxidoreductase n=1 Tax=Roseiterribacter gracilis TaxID=2812848 RepID=A0A8S8XIK0_9PROT|nr:oxidoreductase [Rhodospirillales bacterium TMPK1]